MWKHGSAAALAALFVLVACDATEPDLDPSPQIGSVVLTAPDTLAVREAASLAVVVTDPNDVVIAEPAVVWASTAQDVASVDGAGRISGAGEGTALVTATVGPVADTAAVEVALGLLFAGARAADDIRTDLYTMTRHGTKRRNITDVGSEVERGGTWSPDRTRIAYFSTNDGTAIKFVNADGSGFQAVPTGLAQPPNDLAWSPDGDRLAFSTAKDGVLDASQEIYVINTDGTGLTMLTDQSGDQRLPAWSPDGTRIAFTTFDYFGENSVTIDVAVMDADGSNVVNLTQGLSGEHYAPVWSPDGSEIAFSSGFSDPSRNTIHRMDADGSNIRRVGVHGVSQLDWSPDGALFVFVTRDVDGKYDIFSMPADGGDLTRITNDSLREEDVRWR